MKRIRPFSLMAMAMLSATSGIAQAQQHVVGGMGEEIRLGAFAGPGTRAESGRRGFDPKLQGGGRTPGAGRHGTRPTSVTRTAPTLPGKHLP